MIVQDRAPTSFITVGWKPPSLALLRRVSEGLRDAVSESAERPGEEHSLDIYTSDSRLLRGFFLLRLRMLVRLINRQIIRGALRLNEVVDLGGGTGIMSAIIAPACGTIRLVDLNCDAARLMFSHAPVQNVLFEEGNALARAGRPPADVVIAADVLEHFRDLPPIVGSIRDWLAPQGMLLTSLPTENVWYRVLRLVFGKTKPEDHYHTAYEVEAELRRQGFVRVDRLCHPLGLPLFPLFSISAWRKQG